MSYYGIDDGNGNQVSTGLTERDAYRVAQERANERDEPMFVYEVGSDETIRVDSRVAELLSACAVHDHGDGCLGIIVREALKNDPDVTAVEIMAICREAEEDARIERDAP